MARLYDPETWLKENAKPSWKITPLLGPMRHGSGPVFMRPSDRPVSQTSGPTTGIA